MVDDLRAMSDQGEYERLLKRIMEAYRRLDDTTDLLLVEGSDFQRASRALEFDFDADVANHLGCPVLLVVRGSDRSVERVLEVVLWPWVAHRARLHHPGHHLQPGRPDEARRAAPAGPRGRGRRAGLRPARGPGAGRAHRGRGGHGARGRVPAAGAGAEEPSTRREVGSVIVGAMNLPHFLDHIRDGDMIITPGDRADLIVGSLASRFSEFLEHRRAGADPGR